MASFSVLFIVTSVLYELNYELHRGAMLAEGRARSSVDPGRLTPGHGCVS